MNDIIDALLNLEAVIEEKSLPKETKETVKFHLTVLEGILWPHYS